MKKRIEKYFPAALKAVEVVLMNNDPKKVIEREFQGYISAFGSSVLQMGILPTLAVYADAEPGSAQPRKKILQILAQTIKNTQGNFISAAAKATTANEEKLFESLVNSSDEVRKEMTEHLLDATVAIKLCLRTFNLSKP